MRYLLCLTLSLALSLITACGGGGDAPSGDGSANVSAAKNDLNGDGRADLVLDFDTNVSPTSFRIGYAATGSGQFDAGQLQSASFETSAYTQARAVATADVDNDGRDDILVQLDTIDGFVDWEVLLSNTPDFTDRIRFPRSISGIDLGSGNHPSLSGNDSRAVAFTDVDGDGHADLLISTQSGGNVFYFLSRYAPGAGAYGGFELVRGFDPSSWLGRPSIVAVTDVDDNGTADIVIDVQYGTQHCFITMLYLEGDFNPHGNPSCLDSATNTVRSSHVAHVRGDSRPELVVSYDVSLFPGEIRTEWLAYSLVDGQNGTVEWFLESSPEELLQQGLNSFGSGSNRIVAVADLDNDGIAEMLVEKSMATYNEWWTYSAAEAANRAPPRFWVSGTLNEKAIGLGDYNGDGLLDLLIDFTDTTTLPLTQQLLVRMNIQGMFYETASNLAWYQDTNTPRILGLEENGLTSLSHDETALIAWAGVADTVYTPNEFRQLLATKNLALAPNADIQAGNPLPQDQCTISYSQADASRTHYNVGAEAEFGLLVCNIKLGDRASVRTQVIYGGCRVTDGLSGASGKCQVGLFQAELELDLSPAPNTTLGVKGPNAEACGGVSTSNVCANVGAELASTSAAVEAIGVGGGVKLAVGVGAGADFSIEDGVISGEIDLKFLVGGSIEFSLDPAETGQAFYKMGETTYLFAEEAGETIVYAAGPAIIDAANAASDGLNDVANVTAGGAVYVASEVGSTAVVLFEDGGEAIGTLFTGLANAATSVGNGIIDAGNTVVNTVTDIFDGGCFGIFC